MTDDTVTAPTSFPLPPPPKGAPSWYGDQRIDERSFRLADLSPQAELIEGRTFYRCTIYGPAVLFPVRGVEIGHCVFTNDPDAFLWEVAPNRKVVIGAIGAVDCKFLECTFIAVGIAGSKGFIDNFRASFGGGPSANSVG